MQHFELLNFRADLRVGEPGPLVACSLGLHSLRSAFNVCLGGADNHVTRSNVFSICVRRVSRVELNRVTLTPLGNGKKK